MALYMLQAKYTPEAIRNIAESGSNREAAARAVVEQCGGKLLGFYGMLGRNIMLQSLLNTTTSQTIWVLC